MVPARQRKIGAKSKIGRLKKAKEQRATLQNNEIEPAHVEDGTCRETEALMGKVIMEMVPNLIAAANQPFLFKIQGLKNEYQQLNETIAGMKRKMKAMSSNDGWSGWMEHPMEHPRWIPLFFQVDGASENRNQNLMEAWVPSPAR